MGAEASAFNISIHARAEASAFNISIHAKGACSQP